MGYIRKNKPQFWHFLFLHSSCEHLQELLRLICNLIGLSIKLWKWLTPVISSVAMCFVIWGILQWINRKVSQNLSNKIWILKEFCFWYFPEYRNFRKNISIFATNFFITNLLAKKYIEIYWGTLKTHHFTFSVSSTWLVWGCFLYHFLSSCKINHDLPFFRFAHTVHFDVIST